MPCVMNYRASPIRRLELGIYASPDYLQRHETPNKPEDLTGWEWVIGRAGPGGVRLCFEAGRGRRYDWVCHPVIRCNDYAATHRMLLASGGIGVIPSLVASNSVREGRLQRVLPAWSLGKATLHAITVAGAQAPARVRLFRDFLRET